MMMMRWIGFFGIALTAFLGCSLEDALENAPCETDEDCLGDYACVRTQHQTATLGLGWCRNDGQCAAGVQEGCLAQGGDCTGLSVTPDPSTGNVYCCDGAEATVTNLAADGTSAQCVSCPTDLCNGMAPATEECAVGEPRCEAVQDTCGCRVPEDQIENSECAADSGCGDGFVCTRTPEQQAEPDDVDEPAEEDGWCRPSDAPGCVEGRQEGCRTTTGCSSPLEEQCSGVDCFCCESPSNSSQFNVHVYMTSSGDIACIQCDRTNCDGSTTCTAQDDMGMGCDISSGICGCRPTT